MGRCEYQSRDIDALIEPTKTFKWGGGYCKPRSIPINA